MILVAKSNSHALRSLPEFAGCFFHFRSGKASAGIGEGVEEEEEEEEEEEWLRARVKPYASEREEITEVIVQVLRVVGSASRSAWRFEPGGEKLKDPRVRRNWESEMGVRTDQIPRSRLSLVDYESF